MGTVGREVVGPEVNKIIDLLNQAIAAEVNDAYRYLLLSHLAEGIHSGPVVRIFAQAAQHEWGHVAKLMERVTQLNGEPMAAPSDAGERFLRRVQAAAEGPLDPSDHARGQFGRERAAIRFYRKLFDLTQESDPVTADLARAALADEIEDEDEFERLLASWPE